MKPYLLLVEDDEGLGETIKERLEKEKFRVRLEKTYNSALETLNTEEFSLAILDLRLPDGSGFDLAKILRTKNPNLPFLFLTAQAGAKERLLGFELGAVEFIPKPFHLKEFMIRLERVLAQTKPNLGKKWKYGNIEIHLDSFEIKTKAGSVLLSKRDCALLSLLLSNSDKVFSRSEILDELVGEESFPTERTIDNAIVRLRDALGDESIRNVRGVGYKWEGTLSPF